MEIKPKRVISSRDYETGNLPSCDFDSARVFNENPTFDSELKPYKFIGPIKSNTRSHGWHIQMKDTSEYLLVLQHREGRATECVSIYHTDGKQTYNPAKQNPIVSFTTAVDCETVFDKWLQEQGRWNM